MQQIADYWMALGLVGIFSFEELVMLAHGQCELSEIVRVHGDTRLTGNGQLLCQTVMPSRGAEFVVITFDEY